MTYLPMPEGIHISNGCNEPCDTLSGPCCCGAAHLPEEIALKLREMGHNISAFQLRAWRPGQGALLGMKPTIADIVVGYELHDETARCPTYAHDGDAGADLYAVSFEPVAWREPFNEQHSAFSGRSAGPVGHPTQVALAPGSAVLVHTRLSLFPPRGYEVSIRGRSGLAFRKGVVILHIGTGDMGFTGEYDVMLKNESGSPVTLSAGDRIAQAVFASVARVAFQRRDKPESERGDKGYGSSGS